MDGPAGEPPFTPPASASGERKKKNKSPGASGAWAAGAPSSLLSHSQFPDSSDFESLWPVGAATSSPAAEDEEGAPTRQELAAALAALEKRYNEEVSRLTGALNRQNDRHAITLQEEREISTVASKAAVAAAEEADFHRFARERAEETVAQQSEELEHLKKLADATGERAGHRSPGSGERSPVALLERQLRDQEAKLRGCEEKLASETKVRKSAQRMCEETAAQLKQAEAARQAAEDRVAEVLASSSEQLAAARRQEEELVHETTQLQRKFQEMQEKRPANEQAASADAAATAADDRSLQLVQSEAAELRAEVAQLKAALRAKHSHAGATAAAGSPTKSADATIGELRRELRRQRVVDHEREEETTALRKEVVRLRAEITVLHREKRFFASRRGAHKSSSQPAHGSGDTSGSAAVSAVSARSTVSAAGQTRSGGGSSTSSSNPEEQGLLRRVEAAEAHSAALASKLRALTNAQQQPRQVPPPPSPDDGEQQQVGGVDTLAAAASEWAQTTMAVATRSGTSSVESRDKVCGDIADFPVSGDRSTGAESAAGGGNTSTVSARERLEREKWKRVSRHEKEQRERAEAALSESLRSLHELQQQQQLSLYYSGSGGSRQGDSSALEGSDDGIAVLFRELSEWRERHAALERRYAERVAGHRDALAAAHAAHEQIIEEASAHAKSQQRLQHLEGNLTQSRKEGLRWREQQQASESELAETKRALTEAEHALATLDYHDASIATGGDGNGGGSHASQGPVDSGSRSEKQKLRSHYGKRVLHKARASAKEEYEPPSPTSPVRRSQGDTQESPEEEEDWGEVVGALHERRTQKRELQQLRRANKMLQHQVAQLRRSVADFKAVVAAENANDGRAAGVTLVETMGELRSALSAAEARSAEQQRALDLVADQRAEQADAAISEQRRALELAAAECAQQADAAMSEQQQEQSELRERLAVAERRMTVAQGRVAELKATHAQGLAAVRKEADTAVAVAQGRVAELEAAHEARVAALRNEADEAVKDLADEAVALAQQHWEQEKRHLCATHVQQIDELASEQQTAHGSMVASHNEQLEVALDELRQSLHDSAEEAQLAQAQAHDAQLALLREETQEAIAATEAAEAAWHVDQRRLEQQASELEAAADVAEENRQAHFESEKQARESARDSELVREKLLQVEAHEDELRRTVDAYAIKLGELQTSLRILEDDHSAAQQAVAEANASAASAEQRVVVQQELLHQQAQAHAAQRAVERAALGEKKEARDTASMLNEEVIALRSQLTAANRQMEQGEQAAEELVALRSQLSMANQQVEQGEQAAAELERAKQEMVAQAEILAAAQAAEVQLQRELWETEEKVERTQEVEQGERELLEKQQVQLQELLKMLQSQQEAEAALAAEAAAERQKQQQAMQMPGSPVSRATAAAISTTTPTAAPPAEAKPTQQAGQGLAVQASQWMREHGITSIAEAQSALTASPAMTATLDQAVQRWIATSDLALMKKSTATDNTGAADDDDDDSDEIDDDDQPGSTPRFSPGGMPRKAVAAIILGSSGGVGSSSTRLPRLPLDVGSKPTLAALRRMSPAARQAVKDYTLQRPGYGTVSFNVAGHEYTDINGIDLTDGGLVWAGTSGTCTSVELFPEQPELKPPVGEGLNKPATITLHFRKNLDECKLRLALARQPGVRFLSYDTVTGLIAFVVDHF